LAIVQKLLQTCAFGSCNEERLPDSCADFGSSERCQPRSQQSHKRAVFRQKARQSAMIALRSGNHDFGV